MAEPGESQHTTDVADEPATPRARDFYAVLGVAPSATEDEIRHAFHTAAKQWHPDHFTNAGEEEREHAERQMRALIEAHAVLSDPARRALYDAQRQHHAAHGEHAHAIHHEGAATSYDWQTAGDPADYDRVVANNDPRGVASFLGVLLGLAALALFRVTLRENPGLGSYIGLVLAIIFGAAALWCFADPAGLARAAERLAPRAPARRSHSTQHHPARPTHGAKGHEQPAADGADSAGVDKDAEFERLVDEAVASIPDEFKAYMRNVVVRVRPQPTTAERRLLQLRERETLFGLYHGVALTEQGAAGAGPEVITIYQRPIEEYCHGDADRIRDQVRRTVLHELAHHFGLSHEEMPDSIR